MSKALNSFFAAIYLLVFIVSAGVCVYYAVAAGTSFVSFGDNILYGLLLLVGTIFSAAIHWDAREVKKTQLRHRVFLGMTLINFVSFVWLVAAMLNCQAETCANEILIPLIATIFVWIITFSFGVTVFMKLNESGVARLFAILFSLGALFWSYLNLQANTPFWGVPFALAVIGLVAVVCAPRFAHSRKR